MQSYRTLLVLSLHSEVGFAISSNHRSVHKLRWGVVKKKKRKKKKRKTSLALTGFNAHEKEKQELLGEPHAKNSGSFKQLKRPVCDLMTISVYVQLWLCDRIRLRRGNKTSCHFSWATFIAVQSFVSAGVIVNPQANVGALLELMSMQYNFIDPQKSSTSTLSLKTSLRCCENEARAND